MTFRDFFSLARVGVAALLAGTGSLQQAHSAPAEVIRGPIFSGTLGAPRPFGAIAMKGLVVTVGASKNAYVCYDTDAMRVSMAWTGDFLELGNTQSQIAWPPPPIVKGTIAWATRHHPGWASQGAFTDPRTRGLGPLPKNLAHYKGAYIQGNSVTLKYSVGSASVLDHPGFEEIDGQKIFTRTIQFDSAARDQAILLADGIDGNSTIDAAADLSKAPVALTWNNGKPIVFGGSSLPKGARLEIIEPQRLILRLPEITANQPFTLHTSTDPNPAGFARLRGVPAKDLRELTRGGPAQWTQVAVTQGVRSTQQEAYVVDTLTEPTDNPYNAKTFFGGFDFLSDGRAAICTFHGDVWLVSGIDDKLNKLTWRRYATGLFQPLGLKVVEDQIYVLGRDQITRLVDVNKDGEADFYENFNNDSVVTANYHEFSLDLHTDRAGNFYYAKGAPYEPEVMSPHQGSILKVSRDGSTMEVFATGLRAPNGMAIGPGDEITVSDNQGHWMPSSKLNWVVKGGFYGMTPTAQKMISLDRNGTNIVLNPSDPLARRQLRFQSWDVGAAIPTAYDKPVAWVPMNMDNSSGGQVWVTGNKWGPLNERLLFMSYGKCTLFEVMFQEVDGVRQAAMIQLPLRFNSGIHRGRINPRDGQLYVCGLKGWQTSATRDGGFYRVRYTGAPVRLPNSFHASKAGVKLGFTSPVDAQSASDPGSYNVERWNYLYSGGYGSPDLSVSDPAAKKRDVLEVKSVKVSADGTSVSLLIDDMKPSDQLRIRYSFNMKDGKTISQDVYGTVYKLAERMD